MKKIFKFAGLASALAFTQSIYAITMKPEAISVTAPVRSNVQVGAAAELGPLTQTTADTATPAAASRTTSAATAGKTTTQTVAAATRVTATVKTTVPAVTTSVKTSATTASRDPLAVNTAVSSAGTSVKTSPTATTVTRGTIPVNTAPSTAISPLTSGNSQTSQTRLGSLQPILTAGRPIRTIGLVPTLGYAPAPVDNTDGGSTTKTTTPTPPDPANPTVPDGGATASLLGIGLISTAIARKKLSNP